MSRNNRKFTAEEKLHIAREVSSGETTAGAASGKYHSSRSRIQYWVALYKAQGETAFSDSSENKVYSYDLKINAVRSYLNGEGSLMVIAAQHGLSSEERLREWVKMYNNGDDFGRKMSGGSRMKTSRKTTKEERLEIVKHCIATGRNYGETAIKYNVSYQQVRNWTKRYTELGEAGLEDRRGKRKADQEPRNEIEKLQIEIEQLKHKLYMTEMERDLLKKVKELERKDLYRK